MNERLAFLKAIMGNPFDQTVRLVYADWLQENGQELLARATRYPSFVLSNYSGKIGKFRKHANWVCTQRKPGTRGLAAELARTIPKPDGNYCTATFMNGFLNNLYCSWEWFSANLKTIYWQPRERRECPLTAQPILTVHLTTTPTLMIGQRVNSEVGGVYKPPNLTRPGSAARPILPDWVPPEWPWQNRRTEEYHLCAFRGADGFVSAPEIIDVEAGEAHIALTKKLWELTWPGIKLLNGHLFNMNPVTDAYLSRTG